MSTSACVSPTTSNSSETLCTLQFADRVSCIENKAQKNVEALCASGSSSPQRVSSSRSATASPRNSMRGRSASEIEISRLQEQILMLKHQLDMATAGAVEPPVHCATYEPVAPSPAPVPPTGSKLTPPWVSRLPKSSTRREPEPIAPAIASRKPSTQGSSSEGTRPRSASISEVQSEEETSDGKAAGPKPSMLVRPRILLSDRSPPRDATTGPAASSPAKAPAKPPRSSVAIKLFIERMNSPASTQSAELGAQVKAEHSESTESRPQESAARCEDQQTANDSNDNAQQTTSDSSADIAKSPSQDEGAQPQSVDTEVILKPQTSPTLLPQPRVQVHHGRRQSSPSAFAVPQVSTKLKSFMESVKQPIRLPARERSDSLSSSSSRSPRSSPSSPSSASTSSVSPMSARRQSLATTGGAVKSALIAFMEKVKPNGYANLGVEPSPSSRQREDEVTEPELADVGGEARDSSEPELTLELKGELSVENAEASFTDEGQLEQESSPTRPHNVRQEESDGILLGDESEEARGDDGDVPITIEPAEDLDVMTAQGQTNEPEAQQRREELCDEDLPGELDAADFRLPAIQDEDVAVPDAGIRSEDLAPRTPQQDGDASDEHQYMFLAGSADEWPHNDDSQARGGHDVADTPAVSSKFDANVLESSVDSVESRSSVCSACVQGCGITSLAPASTTATFAPADAAAAPQPR